MMTLTPFWATAVFGVVAGWTLISAALLVRWCVTRVAAWWARRSLAGEHREPLPHTEDQRQLAEALGLLVQWTNEATDAIVVTHFWGYHKLPQLRALRERTRTFIATCRP